MKRNVHTPFGLPLADGKVEEYGKGIHNFDGADLDHWMVKACGDEINDAEMAEAEAERDALRERVQVLEDANGDLAGQIEALKGREADLVSMLAEARAGKTSGASGGTGSAGPVVGNDANGSPTTETDKKDAAPAATKPAAKK